MGIKYIKDKLDDDFKIIEDQLKLLSHLKDNLPKPKPLADYIKSINKKRFDYVSLIIFLYGILEYSIREICHYYIENIETYSTQYSEIDNKIQAKHLSLSISLLNKVSENKYTQYSHLKEEDIIQNLYACLKDDEYFKLNKPAFTINSGNLTHSKICQLFKNLNLDIDQELRKFECFKKTSENTFNKIDTLVEYRNEVAHGEITRFLDKSEIEVYVNFLNKYLRSIFKIVDDKCVQQKLLLKKNSKGQKLTYIKKFSSSIICVKGHKRTKIKIGDKIIIEKKDGTLILSNIMGVKKYYHANTIKLDVKIRGNEVYYWLYL